MWKVSFVQESTARGWCQIVPEADESHNLIGKLWAKRCSTQPPGNPKTKTQVPACTLR